LEFDHTSRLMERLNNLCNGQQHARPKFIGRSYGTAGLEFDHTSRLYLFTKAGPGRGGRT
jgi:hypothetical protein